MKKFKIFILCGLVFSANSCADVVPPRVKGRLTVYTDDGRSLAGREININFDQGAVYYGRTGQWFISKTYFLDETNSVEFDGNGLGVSIRLDYEGFWPNMVADEPRDRMTADGNWVPADMNLTMTLRRKISPRPLFVKMERAVLLQELGVTYGYDFERGDLVRPHGRGVRSDIFFTMSGEMDAKSGDHDLTLVVTFPNEGDGFHAVRNVLSRSERNPLVLGQTAPEDGYVTKLVFRRSRRMEGRTLITDEEPPFEEMRAIEGYWFRTHSQRAEGTEGEIRGRHGKIFHTSVSPIVFSYAPPGNGFPQGGVVGFHYIYAPDHSRSLEFNGANLLPRPPGQIENYYPQNKH